jgi:hypothetical protein
MAVNPAVLVDLKFLFLDTGCYYEWHTVSNVMTHDLLPHLPQEYVAM